MSPRSSDDAHLDYEALAVRAEQQAEAATDAQMAERWRRIAATYGQNDPIHRNHELIDAAAKARSDIKETELQCARERVRVRTIRAASQESGKVTADRELAIFNRTKRAE
jgi:hypothetical protein